MIDACDNYVSVNPGSPKIPEVLAIKGSVFYNNGLFEESRAVYSSIVDSFPKSSYALDAIRNVAQSYFQEKRFDEAQKWYRKMHGMADAVLDKEEAMARIAQSLFKLAEDNENNEKFNEAAVQYEKVAREFPDVSIADAALFNAGNAYEKQAEWSGAILAYQRLFQKYKDSKLAAKARFRTGKCYEKLMQWDNAAGAYLHMVKEYPESDLCEAALYNAGFCFENAGKQMESAAVFEKLAVSFPDSKDAPDVLFRAVEIYGKLKDWPNVTRVTQEFSRRYGNDISRIVQAQCMLGIALYMQNRENEALEQLKLAVATYGRMEKPSDANRYYAARAQFTTGEIFHDRQNSIKLSPPAARYRSLLDSKTALLDSSISAYSKVIAFQMSDWTTRSVFQIGQAYEDFAAGIFNQERPPKLSFDEQISLELGIANAVEQYFIEKALHYHEQNVKLGIKEKIEDKYILNSRMKLTRLPFTAGANFLSLVDIIEKTLLKTKSNDLADIARKLQTLQKIAPFQERAIALFTKTLENGTMYQEKNEFFNKASTLITRTSFTVGETYSTVAGIARDAPIPAGLDDYEKFVYLKKVLDQIREYEDSALKSYLKTMKTVEAYAISDEYVNKTRERLPHLLFTVGRCYDVLSIIAVQNPPFPKGIGEQEKTDYIERFQEIGIRLHEQAFEFYRAILEFSKQKYASGVYVNNAYVRLFQYYPEEFGNKDDKISETYVSGGQEWKCSRKSESGWNTLEFDDSKWEKPLVVSVPDTVTITGLPSAQPVMRMPSNTTNAGSDANAGSIFFRRIFYQTDSLRNAVLYAVAAKASSFFINGKQLAVSQSSFSDPFAAQKWDISSNIKNGKNLLAISIPADASTQMADLIALISLRIISSEYRPQFPGTDMATDSKTASEEMWIFPLIKNFVLPAKPLSTGVK
jgi:TolA-binding protein